MTSFRPTEIGQLAIEAKLNLVLGAEAYDRVFPGFEVLAWYALFAPRETPKPVVAKLAADIEKIVALPDIRDKMLQLGAEPRFMNPEQVASFVAVESPRWGQLIRESGAAAD